MHLCRGGAFIQAAGEGSVEQGTSSMVKQHAPVPCSAQQKHRAASLRRAPALIPPKAKEDLPCRSVLHCTGLVGLCSCLQVSAQNTGSTNKPSCNPPATLKLPDTELTEALSHKPDFFAVYQRLGSRGPFSTAVSCGKAVRTSLHSLKEI